MVGALVIVFVFAVVFGAAATPPVYAGLLSLDFVFPFSRVFDRVAMVGALIGCLLLRRRFGFQELREALIQGRQGRWVRELLLGMALTAGMSFLILPFIVGTGELEWRERSVGFLLGKMAQIVPAALLISLIEESFFRVLVFRRLLTTCRMITAMAICSAAYALVHFIVPVKSFVYPGFSFGVGFSYVASVVERILLPATIFPFIGLFAVGMILCYVMMQTRSIYLCIGLHAGWIVAVKMALHTTKLTPGFNWDSPFEARYFLASEPVGWGAICFVGVILWVLFRRRGALPEVAA